MQWLKLLQGAHIAPACCIRLIQLWGGIQGALIHTRRNSTETPFSSSTMWRLPRVWGCSSKLALAQHQWGWELPHELHTPTGKGNVLFLDGAPPPADCLRSDLHISAGKKEKGGKECSFISAMMVSRPRTGYSDCLNETCTAFCGLALNAGMESAGRSM